VNQHRQQLEAKGAQISLRKCGAPARNRHASVPRQSDTWRLNDATFTKLLLDFTRDIPFSEQRRNCPNCTNDFVTRKILEQIGAPSARSPGVHQASSPAKYREA
jgi:hypothetical protein